MQDNYILFNVNVRFSISISSPLLATFQIRLVRINTLEQNERVCNGRYHEASLPACVPHLEQITVLTGRDGK